MALNHAHTDHANNNHAGHMDLERLLITQDGYVVPPPDDARLRDQPMRPLQSSCYLARAGVDADYRHDLLQMLSQVR